MIKIIIIELMMSIRLGTPKVSAVRVIILCQILLCQGHYTDSMVAKVSLFFTKEKCRPKYGVVSGSGKVL